MERRRRPSSGEKKIQRPTNDDKVLSKRRLSQDESGTSRNFGEASRKGEQEIVRTISELGKELSDLEAEIARGGSDQLRETMLHLREEIARYAKRLDSVENLAEKQRKRNPQSEESLAGYISSLEREIAGHEARLATRSKPGLGSSLVNTISRLKKKLSWYLARLAGRKRRNGSKVGDKLARKISALEKDISWHEKRPLANAVSRLDNEIIWHEGRHKIIPDSMTPNGHSYGYQKSNGPLTWISSLFGKAQKPQKDLAQSISDLEAEIDWHEGRLGGRKEAEERFSTGGTRENLADSISQLEKEIEWHEQVKDLEREVSKQEQRLAENEHQPQTKEKLARGISQLEKEVELQERAQRLENEIGWHEKRLAGKSRQANSGVITEVPETWTFSKRRGEMGESKNRQHAIKRRKGEGKEVKGEAGKITRSNFWKLPHFATSSDTGRGRAFNWVGSGGQGDPS